MPIENELKEEVKKMSEEEEIFDPITKLTEDKDVLLLCGVVYTVKKGERISDIMDLFVDGKIKMDDEKGLYINNLNHQTFCAQVGKVKFTFDSKEITEVEKQIKESEEFFKNLGNKT